MDLLLHMLNVALLDLEGPQNGKDRPFQAVQPFVDRFVAHAAATTIAEVAGNVVTVGV
jgi:hypothetical protein